MSKAADQKNAANLALYEKLIACNPSIERKGATMPYTSMNGHMFSFLTKQGELAMRLPAGERELFLEKYKTELCVQYGTVMKEYVIVPQKLLQNTHELEPYFGRSYNYVDSLKPKPTKRKNPQKKLKA